MASNDLHDLPDNGIIWYSCRKRMKQDVCMFSFYDKRELWKIIKHWGYCITHHKKIHVIHGCLEIKKTLLIKKRSDDYTCILQSSIFLNIDVLGIIKKSSVPDPKQHETSQYFVKNMRLIDTTGEVDISVMAKKKIDVRCYSNHRYINICTR